MINLKTYRCLHQNNPYEGAIWRKDLADELGPEAMARDEPPDDQFELLLPAIIKGFNLRRKKWYDLVADRVTDVKWNKEAFQKVVMDLKAKDLIRALVSNQLEAEQNTDLIEGMGNGLILLLHGSPGTGKTLTAESVAEITEKRFTAVMLARRPKMWRNILSLFFTWANCGVAFRVLECYEGILILTSSRVGILKRHSNPGSNWPCIILPKARSIVCESGRTSWTDWKRSMTKLWILRTFVTTWKI